MVDRRHVLDLYSWRVPITSPTSLERRRRETWRYEYAYFTPLRQCELCGIWGTPKKVQHRPDVYGWNHKHDKDWSAPSMATLCMACFNRVRPIDLLRGEIAETEALIHELHHERLNHARTIRRLEADPSRCDRAGEGGQAGACQGDGRGQTGQPDQPLASG